MERVQAHSRDPAEARERVCFSPGGCSFQASEAVACKNATTWVVCPLPRYLDRSDVSPSIAYFGEQPVPPTSVTAVHSSSFRMWPRPTYVVCVHKMIPVKNDGRRSCRRLLVFLPHLFISVRRASRTMTRATTAVPSRFSIGTHICTSCCMYILPPPLILQNVRKVSWTCHEHAGAWSRSGSLSAAGESATVGQAGLPSSAASSTAISTAGPAAAAATGGGTNNPCTNPDNVSGSRKAPDGHGADSSEAVAQLESGGSMTNVGSVGKQGKGLGVFAKIKGRFGRHAG